MTFEERKYCFYSFCGACRRLLSVVITYTGSFLLSNYLFTPELGFLFDHFVQDDDEDYHDSRRSLRHIEEEEARAEKRIMNAKKVLELGLSIIFLLVMY